MPRAAQSLFSNATSGKEPATTANSQATNIKNPAPAPAPAAPAKAAPRRTGPLRAKDRAKAKANTSFESNVIQIKTSASELVGVLLDDLHEDPDNPRETFKDIEELAESLKSAGMLQPITARVDLTGKLVIMWGARRYRAAKLAGWTHVPVIIRRDVVDTSILEAQITENSHRSDLDPIEEARAVRRYMRTNKIATHAQAAAKLRHSQPWVSNRLALLTLAPEQQEQVSRGEIGLIKGAEMARQKSGNSRVSAGRGTERAGVYFGADHPLAALAKARCRSGNRRTSHGPLIGAIACGQCWEDVIRSDATRQYNLSGKKTGGQRKLA